MLHTQSSVWWYLQHFNPSLSPALRDAYCFIIFNNYGVRAQDTTLLEQKLGVLLKGPTAYIYIYGTWKTPLSAVEGTLAQGVKSGNLAVQGFEHGTLWSVQHPYH